MQSLAEELRVRATKKSHTDFTQPQFHSDETPVSPCSVSTSCVVKTPVSSSCFYRFVDPAPVRRAPARRAGTVLRDRVSSRLDASGRAA